MPLRIATFNVKDFFLPPRDADRDVVRAKVANVAANLRRAKADVVALQEIGEEAQLASLLEEVRDLGYGAPLLGAPDRRGIRCAILSRLPVLWSQVHAHPSLPFPRFYASDPEPFASRIPLRRGVVHARVDAGSLGEVDVMTAHFKSNLGAPQRDADGAPIADTSPRGLGEAAARSLVQRTAEALYVRGLVDDVLRASPDHAVCVLGDLNDGPDSLPVRIVRGAFGGDLDGRDARLRPCAELLPEERRFSCFHDTTRTLIDHVLVSARLFGVAREFAIYNEELRSHGLHVEPVPLTPDSDHALCVAEFG